MWETGCGCVISTYREGRILFHGLLRMAYASVCELCTEAETTQEPSPKLPILDLLNRDYEYSPVSGRSNQLQLTCKNSNPAEFWQVICGLRIP